jgi:hypothetical protein
MDLDRKPNSPWYVPKLDTMPRSVDRRKPERGHSEHSRALLNALSGEDPVWDKHLHSEAEFQRRTTDR